MSADASAELQLIRALGHPLRQRILKEMASEEEISPVELSRRLRLPLSNVSHHVRALARYEVITLTRTQPVRGAIQHFYRFAIEAEWACGILGLAPPQSPEE